MSIGQTVASAIALLLLLYVGARLVFTAYFLSKQQNEERKKYHG